MELAPPNTLQHHGVKGMKWGVRNEDRPSRKERKKARRAELSATANKVEKLRFESLLNGLEPDYFLKTEQPKLYKKIKTDKKYREDLAAAHAKNLKKRKRKSRVNIATSVGVMSVAALSMSPTARDIMSYGADVVMRR